MKAPLILLADGYQTWKIMEPDYGFGKDLTPGGREGHDRRYKEFCTIKGTLHEALGKLHQIERSRVDDD